MSKSRSTTKDDVIAAGELIAEENNVSIFDVTPSQVFKKTKGTYAFIKADWISYLDSQTDNVIRETQSLPVPIEIMTEVNNIQAFISRLPNILTQTLEDLSEGKIKIIQQSIDIQMQKSESEISDLGDLLDEFKNLNDSLTTELDWAKKEAKELMSHNSESEGKVQMLVVSLENEQSKNIALIIGNTSLKKDRELFQKSVKSKDNEILKLSNQLKIEKGYSEKYQSEAAAYSRMLDELNC